MNKKQIINNQDRKGWFKFMKRLMLGRYKEPEFIFLGEKFSNSAIIISNHEGTDAPMSMELYCDKPIRFWGAHEMNSGLVSLYKYQTRVYYHEKKHWNIHLARLFCLIASPITNLFYKGLNLISTYKDARLVKTLRESMEALKKGDNIVVFPEDSKNGYLEQLEGFFAGFVMLAEVCYKRGMDVPIFVTYFKRKELKYVIDAPIKYSELAKGGATRADIAKRLLDRCNELGRMTFDKTEREEEKELKTATK
ncbi:MAG: hypothetical protein E7622_07235 [Ruminococcaceae bacterium]|nr:hypothetical protein [Oscillospiraceae bacterium]